MAITAADLWTVTPSSAWMVSIRSELDAALGLSLDYVGTIDGAWTAQAGQLAWEVEQRVSEALSGALLASAARPVVIARAKDRGLTPREATSSTMEIEVATGAGGVLPVGTVLRVRAGTVLIDDAASGGISLPLESSTWTVVENEEAAEYVQIGDTVIVECDTAGRVTASSELTFSPVTPISGVATLTSDGTTMHTTGRDAESLPELRLRLGSARSRVGGSPPGLVAAVRDLPWVVAVGLVETPGFYRVIVAPAPPTVDDATALGEAIYAAHAVGSISLGDEDVEVTGADGRPVTISYDVGDTQGVDVVYTVVPESTVTMASARAIARAAIEAEFAKLNPGDTIRYLRAIGALNQPGITGGTLTLDGGVVDVVPDTAADILVPAFG